MIIRTLSVGRPVPLSGTNLLSGIYKTPVSGPLHLGRLGLVGDEQADLINHGGPDKAVCVYAVERYPFWERQLGLTLGPSAFGENLTVEGLTEAQVHIGDVYRVGEALVQVAQPRVPCDKVNRKLGHPGVVERIIETGYTGYYLRVLEEGTVQAGDRFVLVERTPEAPTVLFANRIRFHEPANREANELLARTPGIAEAWIDKIRKRLEQSRT